MITRMKERDIKVVLHGALRKFGGVLVMNAATPAQAIRGISCQLPEFAKMIKEGTFRVVLGSSVRTGTAYTDKDFEKFDSNDGIANLRIRRLLNSTTDNKTTLVQTTSSTFYPPTEIEDCLDAEAFLNTLLSFEGNEDVQSLMGELTEPPAVRDPALPSGLALNLRETDKLIFERIFDLPGFKIQFALMYATQDIPDNHPEWINEIKSFLYPPKVRLKRRK